MTASPGFTGILPEAAGAAIWDEITRQVRGNRPNIRWVNLANFTPAQKQRIWAHLQTHHPEVAATLAEPGIQELRTLFEATVLIPFDLIEEVIRGLD